MESKLKIVHSAKSTFKFFHVVKKRNKFTVTMSSTRNEPDAIHTYTEKPEADIRANRENLALKPIKKGDVFFDKFKGPKSLIRIENINGDSCSFSTSYDNGTTWMAPIGSQSVNRIVTGIRTGATELKTS